MMQAVETWREDGIAVCFTIDAGPNVHVICLESEKELIKGKGKLDLTLSFNCKRVSKNNRKRNKTTIRGIGR